MHAYIPNLKHRGLAGRLITNYSKIYSKIRKYVDRFSRKKTLTAAGEGVFAWVFPLVSSPSCNVKIIVNFTIKERFSNL